MMSGSIATLSPALLRYCWCNMLNPSQTIITQYMTSPRIVALLEDWNGYIDPSVDLKNFYDTIWNIATASGYGLDVWGRIVGVNRTVYESTLNWFGWDGAVFYAASPFGPYASGDAPRFWYNGQGVADSTPTPLPDAEYRRLILLKAAANITNCSAYALNRLAKALYSSAGTVYVVDNLDLTFTYHFVGFDPTGSDITALTSSGILPRPAGVSYNMVVTP